eukprot:GHVN01096132.1.p1 GENE.GHVN01096132.1~~GHVN01096132.1.p1  ORF type:complete len:123 (+),score=0.41 GHVN01096132.1:183-551(+)
MPREIVGLAISKIGSARVYSWTAQQTLGCTAGQPNRHLGVQLGNLSVMDLVQVTLQGRRYLFTMTGTRNAAAWRVVSSANMSKRFESPLVISSIKIKNKVGPNTHFREERQRLWSTEPKRPR